jgi:hypothetical protein
MYKFILRSYDLRSLIRPQLDVRPKLLRRNMNTA